MIKKETDIYQLHKKGDAQYLTFRRLDQFPELRHLFTTRWGGRSEGPCENWNLGYGTGHDPDTPENREYNVAVLAACMGTTPDRTVWTQQTHTTNIRTVTEEDAGRGAVRPREYTDVDGLVTCCRNIALVSHHADCNAVYFYDPVGHVIGLAHSGWRGTLDGISRCMVQKMEEEFGTCPGDLICGIGPSLCQDCFEVDRDVADQFFRADERNRQYAKSRTILQDGEERIKYYIDLWQILRKDLTDSGVRDENILTMGLCTKENLDMFFSHRGQKGWRGLMAASMMLIED